MYSPIQQGEHKDATRQQIKAMKDRTHVLFSKLENMVHRRDITTLAKELKPKREFVLSLHMTDIQIFLYNSFLEFIVRRNKGNKQILFIAFQNLLRIWNHPAIIALSILQDESKSPVTLKSIGKHLATVLLLCEKRSPISRAMDNMIVIEDDEEDDDEDAEVEICLGYESESISESSSAKLVIEGRPRSGSCSSDVLPTIDEVCIPTEGATEEALGIDAEAAEVAERSYQLSSTSPTAHCLPIVADEDISFDEEIIDPNKYEGAANEIAVEEVTTKVLTDWWKHIEACSNDKHQKKPVVTDSNLISMGNKIIAFLYILAQAAVVGDKVLLFSQSLATLDTIEQILGSNAWGSLVSSDNDPKIDHFLRHKCSQWRINRHYLRIDGKVKFRQELIDSFNKPNSSYNLFIISTKAGNMGINLHSANRVIIFDSSWNPANDLQAIYRSYRYGQEKCVFVYRLLAAGSMEERIYRKQVRTQRDLRNTINSVINQC